MADYIIYGGTWIRVRIRMSEVESGSAAPIKVEGLSPSSRGVDVTVKVVSKGMPRETVSRTDGSAHRVSDILVGDETGCIYLTAWDDNVDRINEGDTIDVKNGYVSLFRGSMRLNIGRQGSFDVSQKSIAEPNTQNNLSDKRFEEERRFQPSFRDRGGYGGGGYGGGGRGGGRGRGGGGGYGRSRRRY